MTSFDLRRELNFRGPAINLNRSISTKKHTLHFDGRFVSKSDRYQLESYGLYTPNPILEGLSVSHKNKLIWSARLSESLWAWFVYGRKLLVWNAETNKENRTNPCFELGLPASEVAHQSALVWVFEPETEKSLSHACCIAVSPEGLIRFWKDVYDEVEFIEHNTELMGKECELLFQVDNSRFILLTTTADLVMVTINMDNVRPQISSKILTESTGWLGNISINLSSFVFGSTGQQSDPKTICGCVLKSSSNYNEQLFVVTTNGTTLTKWNVSEPQREKQLFEVNLANSLQEKFSIMMFNSVSTGDMDMEIIDLKPTNNHNEEVIVLIHTKPNQAYNYYILATIQVQDNKCPITSLHVLNNIESSYLNESTPQLLITEQQAFILSKHYILVVTFEPFQTDVIGVDCDLKFGGGSVVNNYGMFFTQSHCLTVVTKIIDEEYEINESRSVLQCPDMNQSNVLIAEVESGSNETRLKSAFLQFVSRKLENCRALIKQACPEELSSTDGFNLDKTVFKVGEDLVNDIPINDPRWLGVQNEPTIRSSSMVILSHLEEKQQAIHWYLKFLQELGLWSRMRQLYKYNTQVFTGCALKDLSEKLQATITFRKIEVDHSNLLDTLIKEAVENNSDSYSAPLGLTHIDKFYKQVSMSHILLKKLCTHSEEITNTNRSAVDICGILCDVNRILVKVLGAVLDYRRQNVDFFPIDKQKQSNMSWILSEDTEGICTELKQQIAISLKFVNIANITKEVHSEISDQVAFLVDVLLSSSVDILSETNSNYIKLRYNLLRKLIDHQEIHKVIELAEKYADYRIIVEVCSETNNITLLYNFMDKLFDQNFRQTVFAWYLEQGKIVDLLRNFCRKPKYEHDLALALESYPKYGWIAGGLSENITLTCESLKQCWSQEETNVLRRQAQLNLYKMTILATNGPLAKYPELEQVEKELEIIEHQLNIPQCVFESTELDTNNIRVLSPEEIYNFYLHKNNSMLDENQCLRALSVIQFIPNKNKCEMLVCHLWCEIILKETLKYPLHDQEIDDPIQFVKNLLFFKTLALVYNKGLIDFLPSLDWILCAEELENFHSNTVWQYIMKIGFEHFLSPTDCDMDFQTSLVQ
ncbi:WD40/YVTN repeat-like-containing domain,Nucleoporin, Nup133/Nup155-like, C-terminal [Cinara cedri]|uniref:WD40/YVTN repeat-like-containing domain,Nucleoporin, Nup133/Nup155-like, C-terminal n=1 Tax=Cinara cedri TaxID=506608 RepID=A0A5E4NGH0_9HEMI|nr:WD40/YVTN repeat-like-containing domain,Nucleoporin, Nup133/Nup155-like, C-terminal [Cinara cedri]